LHGVRNNTQKLPEEARGRPPIHAILDQQILFALIFLATVSGFVL